MKLKWKLEKVVSERLGWNIFMQIHFGRNIYPETENLVYL